MKINNKKFPIVICCLLLFISMLSGCTKGNSEIKKETKSELHLGTVCTITIYENPSNEKFTKVFNRLQEIEEKMTINKEKSEVIDINKSAGVAPVKVSPDTLYVIEKGDYYSKLTDGKFDISIGPLVKLWGIGTSEARVPTINEINEKKTLINYKDILIDKQGDSVMLKRKNMMIDLGGIAKGYAADEAARVLSENGVKHAIINLGGNVFVMGDNPEGRPWKIGVQNPFSPTRGDIIGNIDVTNKTVTTAGIYERYFEENGKKFHHILDPFSGYPSQSEIAGVTVITDKSIDGDGLDTGLLLMGLQQGLEFMKTQKNMEAIFITKDKGIYITPGLKGNFVLTDNSFTLKN